MNYFGNIAIDKETNAKYIGVHCTQKAAFVELGKLMENHEAYETLTVVDVAAENIEQALEKIQDEEFDEQEEILGQLRDKAVDAKEYQESINSWLRLLELTELILGDEDADCGSEEVG